ncbi:MAG: hypothetical protein MR779_04175 [Tenericutes bacterium]|nr:hypothetical protein [Mycoplasmatota bacterium]
MGENKGQTIFLSVIGIATLLVAIIGATFAYFTTRMEGTQGNVNATTAKIGASTFTADSVDATAVLPGWTSEAKNVTVTLGESDVNVDYTCVLTMTANPLTDLRLAVAGDNAVAAATKTLATGETETKIAEGTLTSGESKTMTYTLTFAETGADQNGQQGASIAGVVKCSTAAATVYYNTANPGGTTKKPNAQ